MLFDTNVGKIDQHINRIENRSEISNFELDFTKNTVIVPKLPLSGQKVPIFEAIDGYEEEDIEDFERDHYEEFEVGKDGNSASKKYFSMPSLLRSLDLSNLESNLQKFYRDIVSDMDYFLDRLHVKPHWQQKQFIDAYSSGETNIAVRSGQGPGKTFVSTVVWLHWLACNPYGLLVVTAPTMRQCKDVWLAQARQLVAEADPRLKKIFEFTSTSIKVCGKKASDWGAYLATANKAENFQGIHRKRLGIHCEEASGLERTIIETIQGTLSNAEGTYLWTQIGNPNTRDCAFYDCFYSAKSVWCKLHWNGEETPETPFFSQRRNKEVAEEHGKDSDVYRVRVLGEFPSLDPSSMLSLEELEACTTEEALKKARIINLKAKASKELRRHIGIDLARMGGDENGIFIWEGNIEILMETYSRTDPNDAIDRAVFLQTQMGWNNSDCLYIIDTSGMGEGCVGRVGQKKRMGKNVHEFYSQNTATESRKYANKITEAWCLFCKAVRRGEVYLKKDKKLFDQLSKRRYKIDKKGRIIVESKDEYKARQKGGDVGELGKSPDRADCCIMGYYPKARKSVRVAGA